MSEGSRQPVRAFVAGHPIAHSRSPLIHGHWLERHGIAGTYERKDVSPADFPRFLRELPSSAYSGGNVTIPHKEAAFAGVERRDGAAEAIGAVNTVWIEDGRTVGANTDAEGFCGNLDERAPAWRAGRVATMLGAGGAARAVAYALADAGYRDIRILNRTVSRARELADRFGPRFSAHAPGAAAELLADTDLLVNTTSLGMEGGEAELPPLDALPPQALVTDIVYVPLETPLLAAARALGLATVDGLGMLLHQAAPGFERWFGVRPRVTPELRALVEADLGVHA